MCFFNRLRFKCGHTQTCIFQACPTARHTRGRTYHTTCRPSKRTHHNVRTWELLGSCENCLQIRHGSSSGRHGYVSGMYGNGIGIPRDRLYGHDGIGAGEGYYPYYPPGDRYYNTLDRFGGLSTSGYNPRYWDRGHGYSHRDSLLGNYGFSRRGSLIGGDQITAGAAGIHPDECEEAGCMNINTPKDIQRNFQRSGWGLPYMRGARGLGMNNSDRFLDMGYGLDDGRYLYQGDIDGMGMRGMNMSPELETAPLRMIEGVDSHGFADGYDGIGRRNPFMGRRTRVGETHLMD
ncbi:hypothetical protein TWF730_004301 [Orbilia blumenaviensis]|uniref:Uncharacterized protein n=1 Tax=Orbilia blumenaviensis TaxID=1796055 RepID=A0AAV9U0F8_9PEZI